MNKHLVFVYGTLRRGGARAMSIRFPNSKFIADAKVSGSLYDLGAYPGLQLNESNSLVIGEVYEVDDEILNQLDDFEASSHYWRRQVEISLGKQRRTCWTYEPNPEFYSPRTLITSGDWIEYAKTKTDWPGETRPATSPKEGEPMKRTLLVIVLLTTALFVFFLSYSSASAQEGHQPQHTDQHDRSAKLGRVNFIVSCNPQAQRQFNRAVAWLHSFEYEEAEKAFTEVTITDPRCGMGYWGIAMSNYHPIWAPPTAAELQKGASAIEKAKVVGARTQRERDYIAAIDVFYKDAESLDHRTRAFAFSNAMEQLYRRYPTDSEAGVFYSLTLIATGMMAPDKNYPNEKKAAEILNRVLAREPLHPGVAHYLIHGYDYPALAHLALPAARSYAKIAPASAHARHMPSHIFTRQGLWQEAIRSNLDAKAAARAYAVRNRMPGAWDEQLHAMDYLAYAYLQGAQDKKAWGVLDELNKIQRVDPPNFKVAYSFTAIPARYALERRQWNEAAKLTFPPSTLGEFPWQRFRWAEAHIHLARAIGAARSGDTAAARNDVERLTAIQQALVEVKGDYDWAKQVEIGRLVASAWLTHAEGKHEESLRLMRVAAELDDATEKHPVTPGAILPAREQLGELLLELKEPVAALQAFEISLRSAPNRFNGLYGVARAARLAGDQQRARTYYGKLVALSRQADSIRPEIEEAKAFLASVNVKDSASTK